MGSCILFLKAGGNSRAGEKGNRRGRGRRLARLPRADRLLLAGLATSLCEKTVAGADAGNCCPDDRLSGRVAYSKARLN